MCFSASSYIYSLILQHTSIGYIGYGHLHTLSYKYAERFVLIFSETHVKKVQLSWLTSPFLLITTCPDSYWRQESSCSTVCCCCCLLFMMQHRLPLGDRSGLLGGKSTTHTMCLRSHTCRIAGLSCTQIHRLEKRCKKKNVENFYLSASIFVDGTFKYI